LPVLPVPLRSKFDRIQNALAIARLAGSGSLYSMNSNAIKSVLFVCMGNICRSPAAEGVFRRFVEDAGRTGEFEIDSAGTHGYHVGHPPDSRMLAAARARGYLLDSRARRLERGDFENFDLIVTMDDANLADAQALCPGGPAQLVRMVDYCERIAVDEVPDPYYGGPAGFERVLDILEDACGNLLRQF
jgi:protein-tyrosine phosphatase